MVLVALPWTALAGLALAVVTMTVLATGALLVARADVRVPCECFGTSTTPIGKRHVARNVTLCLAAAAGTGAQASGAGMVQPAGLGLSLGAATVAALCVVFMDDLVTLLAAPDEVSSNGRAQR